MVVEVEKNDDGLSARFDFQWKENIDRRFRGERSIDTYIAFVERFEKGNSFLKRRYEGDVACERTREGSIVMSRKEIGRDGSRGQPRRGGEFLGRSQWIEGN